MSNAGQALSGVVGAVVGFFVSGGNPMGAYYGFQIGYLAGTALFPTQLPHLQGPRIGDGQQTVSVVGQPIPWIFGTQVVGGNIIWASPIREVATTEDVGGKGGPEQSQTTYTYYRSFAILLCEGPIAGVRRIWANGKLIYDRSLPAGETLEELIDDIATGVAQHFAGQQASSANLEDRMTIYLGTEDQMPDPVIESFEGAGNVPAYRGYAYIVFNDVELKAEDGNRIPATWKFEVYEEGNSDALAFDTYSNEVLYPWIEGAQDPRNPLNDHEYRFQSGSIRDNFAQALADAEAGAGVALNPLVLGWETTLEGPVGPHIPGVLVGEALRVGLHVNTEVPNTYLGLPGPPGSVEDGYMNTCGVAASQDFGVIYWWSGRAINYPDPTNGTFGEAGLYMVHNNSGGILFPPLKDGWAVAVNCGGTFLSVSHRDDVRITVNRVPRAPDDCTTEVPGLPGYCITNEGILTTIGEWELDTSTTYRVLQSYATDGPPDIVSKYPLNPARPLGHPQYDDQDFWEAAYAVEVARGRMEEGLTYGVDYPVTQAYGYKKSFDGSVVDVLPVSLASIVSRICDRVGLDEYDVSDLENEYVIGYQISRPMAARAGIEPLRQVGFFDVVERGTSLKFVTRGKAPVVTLTHDDLGAHFSGEDRPPAITTQKKLELELPRQIRVRFQNPERDFDPGEELSPARFDTSAEGILDVDLAVAITPTKAAQVAEVLYRDTWAARWSHSTQVDQTLSKIEPADCILVPVDGRLERMRVPAVTDRLPNLRSLEMLRDDDGAYDSQAVGSSSKGAPSQIPFFGPVEMILLDLPPLDLSHDDPGIYATARPILRGGLFRGASYLRSSDNGASYTLVGSSGRDSAVGVVLSALPSGPTTIFDEANELTIELLHGTIESQSEEDVLDGSNAAAIGADGRWEIIQFKNAENVAGNVWRVTGLLRGRRGTEHAVGSSQSGDSFVLLASGGLARIPVPITDVNGSRFYKSAPIGTAYVSNEAESFTARGVALKPFSPAHVKGVRDDDGNLTISWVRRDRLATDLDDAFSEEVEDYEVDIVDSDGVVRRTISVSETSAVYTDVQQITDFGSAQDSLTVRVYQISTDVGRGYAAEATI